MWRRHREGLGPARARGQGGSPRGRVADLDRAGRRDARPGRDPVRVAIAEDSVLLREGLTRLLGDAGFDVVGRFGNADDLLAQVRTDPPDVAIVDIRLPPTHSDEGLRAALHIRG